MSGHLRQFSAIHFRSDWYEPRHDKTNKVTVRPAKTQISLGIRPVWSESSLCAWWVAKDPSFLHADSEDSDQTGRMPRLIWVFAGRTCHFVGFVMRRLICCFNITKTKFPLQTLLILMKRSYDSSNHIMVVHLHLSESKILNYHYLLLCTYRV